MTEPTELEITVAHKGFSWLEIEVTGKAAHGSRPALGVDAILKMGPILTGSPSSSAGSASGRTRRSAPARCTRR